MKIVVEIKPCISREKLQWLKDEIDAMASLDYRDIIKSVEVV
jgi:hypothetical protein